MLVVMNLLVFKVSSRILHSTVPRADTYLTVKTVEILYSDSNRNMEAELRIYFGN